MKMLTYIILKDDCSEHYAQVDALYERAFPYHEKRSPQAKRLALKNPDYQLQAWFDGDDFIGLIGAWMFDAYSYIEHLAVNDRLRSRGYGKAMLGRFLAEQPATLLEIDPLVTEIAERRLRFYQSIGFKLNELEHFHPTYHHQIADHLLRVLSYPEPLDSIQYQRFNDDLRQRVMAGIAAYHP